MVMMRGSREGESQEESGCPKYFQHTTGPSEPGEDGQILDPPAHQILADTITLCIPIMSGGKITPTALIFTPPPHTFRPSYGPANAENQ